MKSSQNRIVEELMEHLYLYGETFGVKDVPAYEKHVIDGKGNESKFDIVMNDGTKLIIKVCSNDL